MKKLLYLVISMFFAVSAAWAASPKVYSNCYDGYLHVRAEPTSKSKILGKLPNGPEGAELLSAEGKWSKVRVNGVVGYVFSSYLQSKPTEPVYIDAADVVGDWSGSESACLTIKSNGKFVHRLGYSPTMAVVLDGTWYLSRNKLVLKYDDEDNIVTCTVNGDGMVSDGEEVFTKL